jgi:hypothetical protein
VQVLERVRGEHERHRVVRERQRLAAEVHHVVDAGEGEDVDADGAGRLHRAAAEVDAQARADRRRVRRHQDAGGRLAHGRARYSAG